MATKKTKRKQTKPSKAGVRKLVAKNKAASKSLPKKSSGKKKTKSKGIRTRGKSEDVGTVVYQPRGLGPRSAGQSGDLQGLSNSAGADGESVGELIEEGNAFEAEIIKGVEDVPDADEEEIYTHEVPEDDVPEEYLERDE